MSQPSRIQPLSADASAGGSPDALIELRQVVKTFRNAAGAFTVLKGIDAAFYERQFVSIVGRSGSGKSTLLNMMTGIDHPSSGFVRVANTMLHSMGEGRMSVWRGKQMGIVFQFFQLLPMLTLLENVMLPMDFCDIYAPAERESRALALLKMVGLEGLEHKYPAGVAGGQQQSAAVARALANNPPILVADEPTGNLDTRTAERVLEIFEEQVAEGKTVLMVTHDNTLANRAQRKLVISDGELVREGVSRALPNLAHGALLKLSHAVKEMRIASGEKVDGDGLANGSARGADGLGLLIVTQGALHVNVNGRGWGRMGKEEAAACLHAGDVFSSADLRLLGRSFAGLRAESAVDVLVVEPGSEVGASALDDADLREALESIAQARRAS